MTALSKSATSLIYRLRGKGFRIDTRKRTVFVPLDYHAKDLRPLERLRRQFGFQFQSCLDTDTSRARVYISGPIAHYDLNERRAVFDQAKRMLRRQGYLPVNPMDNGLPQPGNWQEHMRLDIANLLRCQYVFFLPDWQFSKGCRVEFEVAMSCGLKVLHF